MESLGYTAILFQSVESKLVSLAESIPQHQQSLSLPPNAPSNNQTIRPQLPLQPNPNPNNNKALQVINIHEQSAPYAM